MPTRSRRSRRGPCTCQPGPRMSVQVRPKSTRLARTLVQSGPSARSLARAPRRLRHSPRNPCSYRMRQWLRGVRLRVRTSFKEQQRTHGSFASRCSRRKCHPQMPVPRTARALRDRRLLPRLRRSSESHAASESVLRGPQAPPGHAPLRLNSRRTWGKVSGASLWEPQHVSAFCSAGPCQTRTCRPRVWRRCRKSHVPLMLVQ